MIKFQGSSSLNVWCGMLGYQIIGPLFYRGSLTGQRKQFLQNDIEDLLEGLPLQIYNNIIWQQDGAPPHCAPPRATSGLAVTKHFIGHPIAQISHGAF